MFYNPSWKLYSGSDGVNGTYYYDASGKMINYFWHLYDQILVSCEMVDYFCDASLRIITKIKENSLLGKFDEPNKELYSDHLPIFFSVKEEFVL